MPRRRSIVSYDVSDDKRRDCVFRVLRNFGDSIQFSVFLCELSATERVRLVGALHGCIHQREDRVMIIDLGAVDHEDETRIEWIGRRPEPTPRIRVF